MFLIGLQPHTLLEKYALDHKILKPNYNPMSMMPRTARKLLWIQGLLGKKHGQVCLEAFDNSEDEFGKTVIKILKRIRKVFLKRISKSPSLIRKEISSI